MLTLMKTKRKVSPVTVALDACGASVMLSMRDVNGITFQQALGARGVGAVLSVCNGDIPEAIVCEGDLEVIRPEDDGLDFKWPCDGTFGSVHMTAVDMLVFEEALKSYCRLLMRSPEDLP